MCTKVNSPLHLLHGPKQSRPPSVEPLLQVLCKPSSTVYQWLLPAGSSECRGVEKYTFHQLTLTLCSYHLCNDTSTHGHQPESHVTHFILVDILQEKRTAIHFRNWMQGMCNKTRNVKTSLCICIQ